MNKKYSYCALLIGVFFAYSACQEFITPKKKKKNIVSEQQTIELDGVLIKNCTHMSGFLIELLRTVFLITNPAVNRVDDYACGEKDCADKAERTKRYEKKIKIKEKIDDCVDQIERMVKELNELVAALDE